MTAWMDELVIDPLVPWLQMGTRALGDAPWLLTDDNAGPELDLRGRLLDERPSDVLATPDDGRAPSEELLSLVASTGIEIAGDSSAHPLDRLGRTVQEDLCLLRRGSDEWCLGAAVLCFPSRWRLADKIGRPLGEVHGPVPNYDPALANRVTSLLDRLGDQIVRRRNWFVHPDGNLFQPGRLEVEPIVPAAACGTRLFVRSERQTLRRLPETGWIVFTIRIQHCTVGEFVADGDRRTKLARYLAEAPVEETEHRGMSARQVVELAAALR